MKWSCAQKSKTYLSGTKLLFLDGRKFQYTFDCVRDNGTRETIMIESGPDDDEAREIAELECEDREPRISE